MKKIPYNDSKRNLLNQVEAPFLIEEMLQQSSFIDYERNEKIVSQAAKLDYLFILLSGKARIIQQEPNGKNLILQFLEAGDFIGELTLVKAEEAPKDVIAIGSVCCLAIPLKVVEELLMKDAKFSTFIAQYIGKKLLLRMEHFSNAQTFELKYRLAALLLEVSVNNQYSENNTQIADYLGVSYRHLTHTFKYLRENGYIERNNTGYEIVPEKLQKLIHQGNEG
ncbi:cyclic nucleotide-binding domain-containing protein [Enterococcus sp.]|uniref:cyclic nucleotide-binding domain-containing protein n=1 Tax=Enterococcus sp. TaxID=35783 RepID=UPI00290BA293|nr:cyclic nucleotide-binding domain-containing protein [Enterococcus sp.]MDU5333950.1 cyclic nucleotide-binding domain-containing protein [Enterococcus sp.]